MPTLPAILEEDGHLANTDSNGHDPSDVVHSSSLSGALHQSMMAEFTGGTDTVRGTGETYHLIGTDAEVEMGCIDAANHENALALRGFDNPDSDSHPFNVAADKAGSQSLFCLLSPLSKSGAVQGEEKSMEDISHICTVPQLRSFLEAIGIPPRSQLFVRIASSYLSIDERFDRTLNSWLKRGWIDDANKDIRELFYAPGTHEDGLRSCEYLAVLNSGGMSTALAQTSVSLSPKIVVDRRQCSDNKNDNRASPITISDSGTCDDGGQSVLSRKWPRMNRHQQPSESLGPAISSKESMASFFVLSTLNPAQPCLTQIFSGMEPLCVGELCKVWSILTRDIDQITTPSEDETRFPNYPSVCMEIRLVLATVVIRLSLSRNLDDVHSDPSRHLPLDESDMNASCPSWHHGEFNHIHRCVCEPRFRMLRATQTGGLSIAALHTSMIETCDLTIETFLNLDEIRKSCRRGLRIYWASGTHNPKNGTVFAYEKKTLFPAACSDQEVCDTNGVETIDELYYMGGGMKLPIPSLRQYPEVLVITTTSHKVFGVHCVDNMLQKTQYGPRAIVCDKDRVGYCRFKAGNMCKSKTHVWNLGSKERLGVQTGLVFHVENNLSKNSTGPAKGLFLEKITALKAAHYRAALESPVCLDIGAIYSGNVATLRVKPMQSSQPDSVHASSLSPD